LRHLLTQLTGHLVESGVDGGARGAKDRQLGHVAPSREHRRRFDEFIQCIHRDAQVTDITINRRQLNEVDQQISKDVDPVGREWRLSLQVPEERFNQFIHGYNVWYKVLR